MFRSCSIRAQLISLAIASVTPFVALTVHHLTETASEGRAAARDQALAMARRIATRLDDHVANVDTMLAATAEAIAGDLGDSDAIDRRLRAIHATLPGYFASLAVLGPDGAMLASATASPEARRGLELRDRDYFRVAMDRRALVIGEPVRSRTSGKWVVIMARPLLDTENRVRALVLAATELERFQQMFAPEGAPAGSIYLVVSGNGLVLARSTEALERIGSDLSSVPAFALALRMREGIVEGSGTDHRERIGGVTRATRTQWTAYAGIRTETALATALAKDRTRVLLSLLATLLAAALAILPARRISAPLLELCETAERIAGGDLTARACFEARGEMGTLGAAFNRMAAALESSAADRRLAWDAVRESEAKLRSVVDGVGPNMFVGLLECDGKVVLANRPSFDAAGLASEDVAGKPFEETAWFQGADEARAQVREAVRRAAAGEPSRFDMQVSGAGGKPTWVDFSIEPLRGQSGRVHHLVPSAMIIDSRKAAEAALEQSRRQLEMAAKAGRVGLFDWDLRTNQIYYSAEWKSQIGYEDHEISNDLAEWRSRVHPDDVDAAERKLRAYIEAPWGHYRNLLRLRHKNGSWRWILVQATLAHGAGGKPMRMMGSHVDITERVHADEALRETEEKLRLFVQYAPAAIAMFDRQMRYVSYSRRWLSDYGLGEADLVGRSHYDVFPEMPERWKEVHRRCLAGATERAEEDPFTRSSGATDWVRWEVRPWYAREGEVGGLLMLTEVVTARKRAEDEVRRLNRNLEREVADRTAALQAANRELAAFDAAVSHDLRAPITRIRGFGTALLEDRGEALGESGQDLVRRVLRAAERMDDLVDDLLRLATAGRGEFARADVDVGEVARSVFMGLAEAHPARCVDLSVAPSLRAHADPGLLRSLLENLIGNAWKFTAGRDPGRIEIGALANEGHAVLFVRDNGAGFDGARADEVFTPFRRLHRQEEFPGTGLGLATVKRIVERHGGRVWAEGEVGRGATVYFTLGCEERQESEGPKTVRTASRRELPSAVFTT